MAFFSFCVFSSQRLESRGISGHEQFPAKILLHKPWGFQKTSKTILLAVNVVVLFEGRFYFECIQWCLRQSDGFAFNTTIELIMRSFNKAPVKKMLTCLKRFSLLNGACVAWLEGSAFESNYEFTRARQVWTNYMEKLRVSVRFAHIASVTRPQDTWSDFFWEDQRSQKVDWDAKQAMQRNLSLQF